MKWPQYSLAYIFLEVYWIAAALGFVAHAQRWELLYGITLYALAIICAGTAIGGLFHRMVIGFFIAAGILAAGVGLLAVLFTVF